MTSRVRDRTIPNTCARQYESEYGLRARKAVYGAVDGLDARRRRLRRGSRGRSRAACSRSAAAKASSPSGWTRELGVEIVALDQSARMVALAAARGVDARVGDVQELPFADESFDVAVAAWMLYHVPDLDRALAELARVLVRGGRLVAVTNREHHWRRCSASSASSDGSSPSEPRTGPSSCRATSNGSSFATRRDGDVCRRGADPRVSPLVRTSCGVRAGGTRPRGAARRAPSPCGLRRRQGAVISAAELIQRKRDGDELSSGELADLVLGYTHGEIPDYQMAAFLMAVYFRGLSAARDVRADRRDDQERRDARARCGARAQGRRQAFDRGRRRQDLDRRRSDRRRLRCAVREDERPRTRAHGRDARQARVDSGLPCRAVDRASSSPRCARSAWRSSGRLPTSSLRTSCSMRFAT